MIEIQIPFSVRQVLVVAFVWHLVGGSGAPVFQAPVGLLTKWVYYITKYSEHARSVVGWSKIDLFDILN